MQRPLEEHLMVAEELAVIRRDDDERVRRLSGLVERGEQPPDRVVELGDHPVVARAHRREL